MSFRLIIACPDRDKSVYQVNTAPLPNRDAVGVAALRALAAEGVRFGIAGLSFGRSVRDAPLGETVTHESGYGFRTEEF